MTAVDLAVLDFGRALKDVAALRRLLQTVGDRDDVPASYRAVAWQTDDDLSRAARRIREVA